MQFPFCSLMCTIWPLTPYSCASVSMAQPSFFFIVFRIGFEREKKNALKKLWSLMLNYSLCARIRVFCFSFSARIISSKVIIFLKTYAKNTRDSKR